MWQKSKAFSFPSKANTVRQKNFMCHEYIKNCVKNLFEASAAFSQPKSFISAHKVYTCFCNHFCIPARDIPQIHLLLGKFECKKLLIKNCWDFLRNPIESPKLFFTYIQNILEDIIHWNYAKILIYKTWKFFDLRKYAFFGHFPISSNLICS